MFNTNIVSATEDKKSSYVIILNHMNEHKGQEGYLVQTYMLNKVYIFENLDKALAWLKENNFQRSHEGVGIDIYTMKNITDFTATLVRAGGAEDNGNICPFYELSFQAGTIDVA